MSKDPFKSRQAKITPRDPVTTIVEHGVHGDRETVPISSAPSRRLTNVSIEQIRPGKYQKRETIDEEKYRQLKSQIEDLGFNFTAVLCVDPDDPTFYNPMMGGHLRIQAAKEIGIKEVPAIIREYDEECLAKGTYMENQARQSLTLIDEGMVFKECQDSLGWTQEEVARNLLVPGGRSHVALCLLTVNAPEDIQEMLRTDPKRGSRCFYYLRQLDVLGEEQACALRAPIIADFLSGKVSTDEVRSLVKQLLEREEGRGSDELSLDVARRTAKLGALSKGVRTFEKAIGSAVPSEEEKEELLKVRAAIDEILGRK